MSKEKHRSVTGRKKSVGDFEHAAIICRGEEWTDYEWQDLIRLGNTVRQYAMGRALVDLEEWIDRLEEANRPKPEAA